MDFSLTENSRTGILTENHLRTIGGNFDLAKKKIAKHMYETANYRFEFSYTVSNKWTHPHYVGICANSKSTLD